MGKDRKPTKGEQERINAVQRFVDWVNEDPLTRGCIVIATSENTTSCAVIGRSENIITAFESAKKESEPLRRIVETSTMVDTLKSIFQGMDD